MAEAYLKELNLNILEQFVDANKNEHQKFIKLLVKIGYPEDIAFLVSTFAGPIINIPLKTNDRIEPVKFECSFSDNTPTGLDEYRWIIACKAHQSYSFPSLQYLPKYAGYEHFTKKYYNYIKNVGFSHKEEFDKKYFKNFLKFILNKVV